MDEQNIDQDEWALEQSLAHLMNNYTPEKVDEALNRAGGKEVLAAFLEWLPEVH